MCQNLQVKRPSLPASRPQSPAPTDADALSEYRRKRDPVRTNEPFGAERKLSSSTTTGGRFVVHLHDASRRHYDLRLQVGRALKSFAVPKGPSLDTRERRLAVLTEDHPLEYADFEEVIPEGSYGAGAMIAWDMGRVTYLEGGAEAGIARGKIDFVLHGHKLGGRFALVRTRRGEGNEWLLIKKHDAAARDGSDIIQEAPLSVLSGLAVEELATRHALGASLETLAAEMGAREGSLDVSHLEPMLCATEGGRLDDPERLYELKLDGVRIVADKLGRKVTLRYRNGGACTATYPEVVRALETLPVDRVVLDGEVVTFDERGRPSFQRLGARIHARRALDVARAALECPVVYLAFDLLAIGGRDLTQLPLMERKQLLARLVRGRGFVRALDHIEGRGAELFELCRAEHLEGVVAKRLRSCYREGPRRSEDWIKMKCERDDDFVVVGWVPGKGSRRELGALCLGSYQAGALRYVGRVGSGLDEAALRDLHAALAELEQAEPSAAPPLPEEARGTRWVRPSLVASVRYLGFTHDGRLRAAVFKGLRADGVPEACTAAPPSFDPDAPAPREASPGPALQLDASPPGLVLTNRDKVFWPEQGITKGDLLDYYASIAGELLPFLRGRPVVLVRHPDGVSGKSFFQWNVPQSTPAWIRTLKLNDPEDPTRDKNVFLLHDVASLLYVINLGCIPLHVLACREASPSLCDFLTVDLDLGEQPLSRAVEVALSLREILDDAGLVGYPKTSGQGGLHVLIPLGTGVPFEGAKLLLELLGRLVTARHESFATMERRVGKRGGKLYVDTGQTGPSRTIVAPYSARAHPGATVSTPLLWEELSGALEPSRFTLLSVPARVAELGNPWRDFLNEKPAIGAALSKLERWVR